MTSLLVDTSVLVAALLEEHPDHSASFKLFEKIAQKNFRSFLASHSLAELFSTLTSIPRSPRLSPEDVKKIVKEDIPKLFEVISLEASDYYEAVDRVSDLEGRGGIVYDALILQAAVKKKVPCIVTWNERHFERFASSVEIKTPDSFLSS